MKENISYISLGDIEYTLGCNISEQEYVLRPLTPADINECVAIVGLNYNNEFDGVEVELKAMFEKDVWLHPEYLVIEKQKKIIAFGGYCLSCIDYDCYGIYWINVHPDYKGQGYGRKIVWGIIDAIKGKIKTQENPWIILSCKEDLLKYYEYFGFEPLHRRQNQGYMMMLNL